MPNLSLTLPDTNQSILRPIAYDIINQIREITKINKNADIYFPGDSQINRTPGTSIDDQTQERFAKFNINNIVFIEVEEDFDHETLGSTAVTRKEHHPVFSDNALGIKLKPIYATTNITINFKYRCISKTEALRWRDDIRIRVSQLRDINLHDITYQYLLPLDILVLLKAIHETKELVEPYNESYEEYIIRNSCDRLTIVGDLVNQNSRLTIAETQCRIVGMYDWTGLPEKPEREDLGVYTISFGYKFSFEKPIGCHFKYPIMVHNNLLPRYYTDFNNKSYDLYDIDKSYTVSLKALSGFESDTIMNHRRDNKTFIQLPEFDDYVLPMVANGSGTVLVALCQIDNNKRLVLNLNELGDISIDHDILQFIRESEYPYICDLYKSILNISLYRNDYLTSNETIRCNQALDISATNDLELRNLHHIRLSIITDLTLLSKEALDRLRRYPKALVKIIAAINELLRNHPDFVRLSDLNYVSLLDFSPIYAALTGHPLDNGRGIGSGQYYGNRAMVNSWPNRGYNPRNASLFADIDPRVLENYRRNRVNQNKVMAAGIIAIKQGA